MEEWKTYLVEDLFEEIAMGPFGSNIKVDCFQPTGVPVLNGSNLFGYKLNEDSFNYVSTEKADSLGRSNAFRGDIVITHRGTLGQIVYIPENSKYDRYVISQSQFRLKLDTTKVLPSFFVYFFHTRLGQHRLLSNASQVGVPAIARPTSTFKKVEIELPSISIQQRIVDILDSIGNKIELNNRINHNLEEQAQALYKSWFVDFEPFKDGKFVESELGMIPEGWRVGTLSEVSSITMGQSPSGTSFNEAGNGIAFYQGRTEFGFRFPTTRLFTTEPARFAEQFSILLSVRAPVGDINIAKEKCCIGRGLASIHGKYQSFVFYTVESLKPVMNRFNGEGTVFGSINRKELEGLKIVVPPLTIQKEFNSITNIFDREIYNKSIESVTLCHLRDTLLPKLMSGELEINEIDC